MTEPIFGEDRCTGSTYILQATLTYRGSSLTLPAAFVLVLLHENIHCEEHHKHQHTGHGGASGDGGRLQQHLLSRV